LAVPLGYSKHRFNHQPVLNRTELEEFFLQAFSLPKAIHYSQGGENHLHDGTTWVVERKVAQDLGRDLPKLRNHKGGNMTVGANFSSFFNQQILGKSPTPK